MRGSLHWTYLWVFLYSSVDADARIVATHRLRHVHGCRQGSMDTYLANATLSFINLWPTAATAGRRAQKKNTKPTTHSLEEVATPDWTVFNICMHIHVMLPSATLYICMLVYHLPGWAMMTAQ